MVLSFLWCTVALSSFVCCRSLELYVSQKTGNDNNLGRHPTDAFKTLGHAQREIRRIKDENGGVPIGGINVNIDSGIYYESLIFNENDSGDKINKYYIKWKGNTNTNNMFENKTIVTGGKKLNLTSFFPCNSPYKNNKNFNLLCLDLSSYDITKDELGYMLTGGLMSCQHNKMELYYNNKPQILSRYPNINYNNQLFEFINLDKGINKTTFNYTSTGKEHGINKNGTFIAGNKQISSWINEINNKNNTWLHGYWTFDWWDTYVKLNNIAPNCSINNTHNNSWLFTSDNILVKATTNARFYLVNLLSELDSETEYYIDQDTMILYWYPPQNLMKKFEKIQKKIKLRKKLIPKAKENEDFPFKKIDETEEEQDYDNENIFVSIKDYVITISPNTEYIAFDSISILYSQISGINTTNWTVSDSLNNNKNLNKNSNNVVNNPQFINITNCEINNHGNHGIDIVGTNLYISNNNINYVGCMGIKVQGGDYTTLTPSNNIIYNNTIYNFGRWKRTYQSGLFWNGVGNVFSYNNVTFGPHNGILGGGNEMLSIESKTPIGGCNNIFEYNYIGNTTFEASDSGAFYTCGQSGQAWINRGNILRHNIFKNIRNLVNCPLGGNADVHSIYLDDQISGWLIHNNTFINCRTGVFIGGGRRNIIKYNYCLNTDVCMSLDNRGVTWQKTASMYPNGSNWDGLFYVNYLYPPWSTAYPQVTKIANQQPGLPVFNEFVFNQYCSTNNNSVEFSSFNTHEAGEWNSTLANNTFYCK